MKALIICGSRKGGFTSEACRSFSRGLAVHGVTSEIVLPIEMDIKHCTGCGDCSKNGECIISDDMEKIYKAFRESDLLVLATPIHFSGPSSAIKAVVDRFQPVWFADKGHPAFITALLSGGGPAPNFKNTVSIFKAFSITAGMEWMGHLEIPNTDEKKAEDLSGPSFDHGKEIGSMLVKGRK
ncbi:MAG: flavodoxin family protein [Candidatus Methanoplasma sp.]|jgi:multimeric flavodoxin WrbA|nr:flavodoxin family protein [Candidatus Methanoplasma sp.]